MDKYINIFRQNGRKECYVVDQNNTANTRKIEAGQQINILTPSGASKDAVLGFDAENKDYYLEYDGEKAYNVQGVKVVGIIN